MGQQKKLKIYLVSIGAAHLAPGIVITERKPGLSIAQMDIMNPFATFAISSAHCPRLLVKYEEAEAREDAFGEAYQLFPKEDGWTSHLVILYEIPRLTFIQMQLFTTTREIYRRILRLAGFRATT
jgi:hypothetical protein